MQRTQNFHSFPIRRRCSRCTHRGLEIHIPRSPPADSQAKCIFEQRQVFDPDISALNISKCGKCLFEDTKPLGIEILRGQDAGVEIEPPRGRRWQPTQGEAPGCSEAHSPVWHRLPTTVWHLHEASNTKASTAVRGQTSMGRLPRSPTRRFAIPTRPTCPASA